jgi:hypothetical protein
VPVIIWSMKDLTADERAHLQSSVQGILQKGNAGSVVLEALRGFLPTATGS